MTVIYTGVLNQRVEVNLKRNTLVEGSTMKNYTDNYYLSCFACNIIRLSKNIRPNFHYNVSVKNVVFAHKPTPLYTKRSSQAFPIAISFM